MSSSSPPAATPQQIWGPFFVMGSPFRASLSPPGAEGRHVVVRGTVRSAATGEPLPMCRLDLWQASPAGEYDYHEPSGEKVPYKEELNTHGAAREHAFRVRAHADERGRYEFTSVLPAPYYDPSDSTWRCPHIHFFVRADGHRPLVTQLYFEGEEKNDVDAHILPECTIALEPRPSRHAAGKTVLHGTFDLALEPGTDEEIAAALAAAAAADFE